MNTDERRLNDVTQRVIEAAFKVSNTLGAGFLEKVYENALAVELRKGGIKTMQQAAVRVYYDGVVVGHYVADLIVSDEVLVELKATKSFDEIHTAQCLNYLRATGLKVCLLLNFGTTKVGIKRIVHQL